MTRNLVFSFLAMILTLSPIGARAQSGGQHMLFGDLKIDESKATGKVPVNFDIILYTTGGNMVARQSVTNNGRYRFMNLRNGEYYLVVEMENNEVARIPLTVASPTKTDVRQDIALEWRPDSANEKRGKVGNISVADYYERAPANQKLFAQAAESTDKKKYDQSLQLLRRIVDQDPRDFQAWTELGTIYLLQSNATEAERAYVRAIEERPAFVLALLNLGRLRIMEKKYESAIEPLNAAVKIQPKSANANYYLGEAYLFMKKGSKAVIYLYEALKLDPIAMATAHLRLAALYNGAGLKDKAAKEYEEFLKKKPDYPDKKKLEQYISANKPH